MKGASPKQIADLIAILRPLLADASDEVIASFASAIGIPAAELRQALADGGEGEADPDEPPITDRAQAELDRQGLTADDVTWKKPKEETTMTNAEKIKANMQRAEDAARDVLIAHRGEEIAPKLRVWAATQPLAIVKALLEAASKGPPAPASPRGLQGPELAEYRKAMGLVRASAPKPHTNAAGDLVLPVVTPTEARRRAGLPQERTPEERGHYAAAAARYASGAGQ